MDAPSVPNLTAPRPTPAGRRDLATLPKAHLHLHFTGAMRPSTMIDMAAAQRVRLPPHLLHIDAASMPADGRGWFRFQRAYDSARHLVRSEAAMRRLIREAADGTDTYELNRNLVLTEGAKADSVPNLEIENGEIKGAGHASATGRFDDEQLFYLMSRGVAEDEARRLVVRGFFAELINQIGVPEVVDHLMATVEAELAKSRNN